MRKNCPTWKLSGFNCQIMNQLFVWTLPSASPLRCYNTTLCVFVLSADVHISIIFGGKKLRTVAALVAARIMQCLNVIRHCVPSCGCLSTQEALELNQTPGSFNLLNTLIHPGQVA